MKQILTIICGLLLILGVKLADYSSSYSSYTEPVSTDVINSGSTVSKVKWVQAALNFCIKKGLLNTPSVDVDGLYGPVTITAVKAFQTKYSLDIDGIFGPQSIKTMKNILGTKPVNNIDTSYSSYTQPASTDVINSGSTVSKVKWVQAALNFCIEKGNINASPLDVDGLYGSATITAVKAFQTKYSLDIDGIFGPQSIKTMKIILGIKDEVSDPKKDPQVWVTTGTGIKGIPEQWKKDEWTKDEMKSGCCFMACCVVGGLGTKDQILAAKKWSVNNGYSRESDNLVNVSFNVLAKKISAEFGTTYHSDFIIKKDQDAAGNTHYWVADAKGKEIFNSAGLGWHR